MVVMMVANNHSVDGGSKWSAVACIGEASGIPVAFLCCGFFFFFSVLAGDLICVGLEFWMVMGCFCNLDSCSGVSRFGLILLLICVLREGNE